MDTHILLVDDDALLRRSLSFNLEQAGYRVCTAASAEDALALAPGQVISAGALLAHVWRAEYEGEPQVVYVHIRWLRKKLEQDPHSPRRILTVRGVGYKLAPQEAQ